MFNALHENQKRGTAGLVFAVMLGVFATFVFIIIAELLTMSSTIPLSVLHIYPEFPAITLSVGILVGLIERNKTPITAILSFVPWSVFMIIGANGSHSSVSRWLISIVVIAAYATIGIGAAILTAKAVRRLSQAKTSAR